MWLIQKPTQSLPSVMHTGQAKNTITCSWDMSTLSTEGLSPGVQRNNHLLHYPAPKPNTSPSCMQQRKPCGSDISYPTSTDHSPHPSSYTVTTSPPLVGSGCILCTFLVSILCIFLETSCLVENLSRVDLVFRVLFLTFLCPLFI
jgi:hypothetical protein